MILHQILSFQAIRFSTKSYRIGSSRTAGENLGVNGDTIEFIAAMAHVDLTRWPRAPWLFNADYINKFFTINL